MSLSNKYSAFFTTHLFFEGVRITIGIMAPILVAIHFNQLNWGLSMALGALCVGITDNAGPLHHRLNGMVAAIFFIFVTALLTGWVLGHPVAVAVLLAIFGFLFSIIGVFGNRAASIGTAVLIAITLQLTPGAHSPWANALLLAAGGWWYFLLSLVLHRIRPYKLVQQVLADCLLATAGYLDTKAGFFGHSPDYSTRYADLVKAQVEVHQKQETVREILFKTRSIVKESTHTGRVLVMAFLEVVDIFEMVLTTNHDYRQMHQQPRFSGIMEALEKLLLALADRLKAIAINLQLGLPYDNNRQLYEQLEALEGLLRQVQPLPDNHEENKVKLALEQVVQGVADLLKRADNLAVYTTYDKKLKLNRPVDYKRFVVPSYLHSGLLLSNLQYKSNIFRYSVRMAIAMLAGYALSLFFPLGHSYWILLTVVVILKPAYALTTRRNAERLAGTLAGGLAGLLCLLLIKNGTALFVMLLASMAAAFSIMRTRYWLSVAFLTNYVIVGLYLLNPGDYTIVIKDRLVDTAIGSAIAWLCTLVISPVWEKVQLTELLHKALWQNAQYINHIAAILLGQKKEESSLKFYRKEVYVALANLSDAFQRMLNEPKSRQIKGEFMHQLVVGNHVMASRSAALAVVVRQLPEGVVMPQAVERLQQAVNLLQPEAGNFPGKQLTPLAATANYHGYTLASPEMQQQVLVLATAIADLAADLNKLLLLQQKTGQ